MKLHRTIPTNASPHDGPTRSRATFLKLGLGAALLPFVSACSPAPMPISRSSNDPSSPSAPDGVSPLIATSASVPIPSGPPTKGHEQHDHQAQAAHAGHADDVATNDEGTEGVVYVCPMHPEVTSTKAGELCPKCNMKLVPKK
jgi:hypothetical protein